MAVLLSLLPLGEITVSSQRGSPRRVLPKPEAENFPNRFFGGGFLLSATAIFQVVIST